MFDFAFVHPATMRKLRIGPADPLLIRLNSLDVICTAWPSTQFDLADVALLKPYLDLNGVKLDAENKNVLLARPNPSRCSEAANIEVDLLGRELFDEKDEIRLIESLLKHTYFSKYVLDRQSLSLSYMGKRLIFKITRIDAKNEMNTLSDRFEKSLKLKIDIQLPTVYRIGKSTRITVSNWAHEKKSSSTEVAAKVVGFKDVAGLDREIQLLKEFFIQPFEFADAYKKIGDFYVI